MQVLSFGLKRGQEAAAQPTASAAVGGSRMSTSSTSSDVLWSDKDYYSDCGSRDMGRGTGCTPGHTGILLVAVIPSRKQSSAKAAQCMQV